MSNYILSNNQTFADTFKSRGNITTDSTGNTGIKMSVKSTDTNPFNIQQTVNDNIIFQTGSTGPINITPNNVSSVTIGSTGIYLNTNNSTNIIMYNSGTTCFKQFNYGAMNISVTVGQTYNLLAYHPRNIFITSAVDMSLNFPTTPPSGTFFRVIKVPATVTATYNLRVIGGTFNLYSNVNSTISSVSILSTSLTVFEFTYISEFSNVWMVSTY